MARKVLIFQTIVSIVSAVIFTLLAGKNSGISAALGGVSCLIPAFIFAHFAFKYAGATQNKLVVQSFSKGNKLKFFMTIILFALALKWSEIQFLPLIVTYIITVAAQWPIIIFLHRVDKLT
ncbi:ATP synthase subunit I [Aliiglaciecola sp. LCG003]|nr:ATP synthase subunit I [Aliiglaciecola sp. LCG003]WJG11355.1 ATP synthase subunit I [Aliiglaciecola sp. LCG003]